MAKVPLIPRVVAEQAQLAERLRGDAGQVWGYIRVSSEGQEEGQSPEVQKEGIIAFCAEQKLGAPEFVFEQASAKNPAIPIMVSSTAGEPAEISPRPLLFMLLGYLCERNGSHLVVWKLDRLARLAYEQELILDLLTRKGARLHSTQRGEQDVLDRSKDSGDPSRVLFRQVLAAIAQYERRIIEMRMRAGMQLKASKGGWVGGARPFGYNVRGKEIVVDPACIETVQRIFYMRDLCGETYVRIAERLRKEFKTEGSWHKVRVSRVIHNRHMYEGVYVDPYGASHHRPDLRMIPVTWDSWLEQHGLAPVSELELEPLDVSPSLEEGFPSYGEA